MIRRLALLLASSAGLLSCTGLPSPDPIVSIDSGQVQGAVVDGVQAFRGIPFAGPPTGAYRWRPPQPVAPWPGIRDARDYGPFCPQYPSPMLWFELGTTDEDCLTLNVWTPAATTTQKRPVMVWIHGGGYVNGSGNIARLNSVAVAQQDVVLVTINYRLTLFGFMVHPDIVASHPDEPAGNYGLMDVVAALDWVQRNIAAFGGDPDNVTVFGESAGAGLVNFLMVMPSAQGLFHRAISQSSSVGMAPTPRIDRRVGFNAPGQDAGLDIARRAGLADSPDAAAALRALSAEELIGLLGERDRFQPVVDGVTVPDQVGLRFEQGLQHKVPYLTGGNSWEASLGRDIGGGFSPEFAAKLVPQPERAQLYPGLQGEALEDTIFGDLIILSHSRFIADAMARAGQPVWSYYFSYVPAARRNSRPGAAHADDIAFVMGTLDAELPSGSITAQDREVSALMLGYWTQFARTGDPNAKGLPAWPRYRPQTGQVLEIGASVAVHEQFLAERMAFHQARGRELMHRSQ